VNLGLHPHSVSCYYVRTLGGVPRVFASTSKAAASRSGSALAGSTKGGPKRALLRILDIAIQFAWGLHLRARARLDSPGREACERDGDVHGIAKVTDFGLAKARGRVAEHSDPVSGQSILVASGRHDPCVLLTGAGEPAASIAQDRHLVLGVVGY
jgi:hypothetical protein